ncbi:MAG: type II toxin-antitoxin system HicA family toxin [Prosthecobacter sp.]
MSVFGKALHRLLSGSADANIDFDDLCRVLTHLGFVMRTKGSHHIFHREGVPEIINLQPRGSLAKPYQVKQVRDILTRHHLVPKDDE